MIRNRTIKYTTNLSESKERIKDAVAEALLSAVNDANYAL